MKSLHRAVKIAIIITAVIFVLLVLYFSYLIVFKGSEWKNDIHNLTALKTSAIPGQIVDRNGEIIAGRDGNRRTYLDDVNERMAFANLTGDYSGIVTNSIESKYMNELYALNNSWLGVNRLDMRTGKDVQLTVAFDLQKLAYDKIMDKGGRGAAVVLNYKTGEILAMASAPTFDPKNPSDIETEDGNYTNRGISAFTPGSTIKVVTLISALETDESLLPTDHYCNGHSDVEGVDLNCNARHGQIDDYTEALVKSCNTYFGKVAVLLDSNLEKTADRLLFNNKLSLDRLDVAESSMTVDGKNTQDLYSTGFGQSDVTASPLHLAMICGAVANEGTFIQPHIVKAIVSPDGSTDETELGQEITTAFSSETAQKVKDAMRAVVRDGYSSYAGSRDFKIYGKSGTAERDNGSHALFMGFTTEEDAGPYACCVILENYGDSGGRNAGPICRDLLEAAVEGGY